MVRLNADLPDWAYWKFKSLVGERKLSETMRNLIFGFIGVSENENMELIEKKIISLKLELETEISKQLALQEKRNMELKKIREKEEEQAKRLDQLETNTIKEKLRYI